VEAHIRLVTGAPDDPNDGVRQLEAQR